STVAPWRSSMRASSAARRDSKATKRSPARASTSSVLTGSGRGLVALGRRDEERAHLVDEAEARLALLGREEVERRLPRRLPDRLRLRGQEQRHAPHEEEDLGNDVFFLEPARGRGRLPVDDAEIEARVRIDAQVYAVHGLERLVDASRSGALLEHAREDLTVLGWEPRERAQHAGVGSDSSVCASSRADVSSALKASSRGLGEAMRSESGRSVPPLSMGSRGGLVP